MGAFAFSSIAGTTGEGHLLRYSPEKGKTGKMIMDYKMDISMDMMGQSMSMDQTMEMGANLNVIENDGKQSTSKITYDFFAMTMENPMMGTMSYDSRKETNEGMLAETMDAAMEEMMNSEITVVTDIHGKTISSEGSVGNVNQTQGSMDMMSMMSLSHFPEKAISIGESWKRTIDDEDSPMKMDITMTLKNVSNGKVTIDFVSDVTQNDNYKVEGEDGEEVDMDMSGTQNGTFIYEQKTMWLIEGIINQDLKMKVEQMGMSIPMKLKGDILLTVE